MSVDTYLKGKQTAGYRRRRVGDATVLLEPKLLQWASEVDIDVRRTVTGRQRLDVFVDHRHGPHCRH